MGEQEVRSIPGNVKGRVERGGGEVMGGSLDQECEPSQVGAVPLVGGT